MESFMLNSKIISGDLFDTASYDLQSEEKCRSSTLRSSAVSSDLEYFFKSAPMLSQIEEEAFDEFWEEEKTVEITTLQAVLSGGKISSFSSTLALDESKSKLVTLKEIGDDDTTVEWTRDKFEEAPNTKEEETLEWQYEGNKRSCFEDDDNEETIMYVLEKKRNLKDYSTNHSLYQSIVLEEVKYPCRQCDFQATTKKSLVEHQMPVHDGVKYPCRQCKHQEISKGNLAGHQRAVYDGRKRTTKKKVIQV